MGIGILFNHSLKKIYLKKKKLPRPMMIFMHH